MKIRVFVSTSAGVLLLWLGVTYVREVPYQNYPRLGKGSLPMTTEVVPAKESGALISLEDGEQDDSLVEVK